MTLLFYLWRRQVIDSMYELHAQVLCLLLLVEM